MKKVLFIFFLIIVYSIVITKKIDPAFIERIDLNLTASEVGITFISLDDSRLLLINKDQTKILVIVEYLSGNKINNILRMFDSTKVDYVLTNHKYNIDFQFDNIKMITNKKLEIEGIGFTNKKDTIQIQYLDHSFCVYEKLTTTKVSEDCHYIYLLNIDKNVGINDNTNMIFYNEGTDSEFLEPIFDKWVDIYMIKKDYYVTLILDKDTYDTITIPTSK